MVRAPFQVLVLPWRRRADGRVEFALFRRADNGIWQGIAGGGEDDELPMAAAKREAFEEAGIPADRPFIALDATASIPAHGFAGSRGWVESVYVIPEHAFGVDASGEELRIAREHSDLRWLAYGDACALVRYDSNRVALWELNQHIHGLGAHDPPP